MLFFREILIDHNRNVVIVVGCPYLDLYDSLYELLVAEVWYYNGREVMPTISFDFWKMR